MKQSNKPLIKILKWRKVFIIGFVIGLIILIYLFKDLSLQSKRNSVLREDYRNEGIKVSVHYKYYIFQSTLVYDLKSISGTNSMADVFRIFLQFADKVQSKNFNVIELSFNGNVKFKLNGEYYQNLGEEYSWQNPIYTTNHFSQNLRNPDGSSAYPKWTGGWLGVTSKQMEDFNDFHKKWYLEDMQQ